MQLVGFVVGLIVLGASIVLGAFMLAALLGFALILAVAAAANDDYIDAEYKVVNRGDRRER